MSSIIRHIDLLKPDETRYFTSTDKLFKVEEIIISTVSDTGKVILLLIMPAQATIESYCPSPIPYNKMKEPLKSLWICKRPSLANLI